MKVRLALKSTPRSAIMQDLGLKLNHVSGLFTFFNFHALCSKLTVNTFLRVYTILFVGCTFSSFPITNEDAWVYNFSILKFMGTNVIKGKVKRNKKKIKKGESQNDMIKEEKKGEKD